MKKKCCLQERKKWKVRTENSDSGVASRSGPGRASGLDSTWVLGDHTTHPPIGIGGVLSAIVVPTRRGTIIRVAQVGECDRVDGCEGTSNNNIIIEWEPLLIGDIAVRVSGNFPSLERRTDELQPTIHVRRQRVHKVTNYPNYMRKYSHLDSVRTRDLIGPIPLPSDVP